MAEPVRDSSQWPVLRIELPANVSPEEYSAHLEAMTPYFQRGEAFGILVDVRKATSISATQRQQLARQLENWHAEHPKALVAIAVVHASVIHRGIATAVNWLLRPAHAMRMFSQSDEATRWIRAQVTAPAAAGTRSR